MTHRPQYELTIHCPRCGDEIEVEFHEIGRYEFAPFVPQRCDACGFSDESEFTRLARDANDAGAEKYWAEKLT